MRSKRLQITTALLLAGLATLFHPAHSETIRLGFQANAKMTHAHNAAVDKAYGLVSVTIGGDGKGRMEVMFSNGSRLDWVKFNAEVRFMDASGRVVEEQYVYRWLEAAGREGASERKVIKMLSLGSVESVEVDFYLSDIIDHTGTDAVASNSFHTYF